MLALLLGGVRALVAGLRVLLDEETMLGGCYGCRSRRGMGRGMAGGFGGWGLWVSLGVEGKDMILSGWYVVGENERDGEDDEGHVQYV